MRLSLTSGLYRLGIAISTISMVAAGVPTQAFANTEEEYVPVTTVTSESNSDESSDTENQEPWYDDIDEMLASGEYVDGSDDDEDTGEVLVTYCGDVVEGRTADNTSAIEIGDPELVYETTGAEYEKASGKTISKDALKNAKTRLDIKDGIVTTDDVNVDVWLVASKTATTEEMLQALKEADDPCILDASPNYKYALDDLGESESATANSEKSDVAGEEGTTDADTGTENQIDEAATQESDESPATGADGTSEDVGGETADNDQSADSQNTAEISALNSSVASATTISSGSSSSKAASYFTPSAPTDITKSADATGYQWAYNSNVRYAKSLYNTLASIGDSSWNTSPVNSAGVIAVVDSGIDYSHPDLSGSMFDMRPYLSQTGGNRYGYNSMDPTESARDNNGHGTHVAGIIAAQTNGYGVSGVSRGAKLISVKAADSRGDLTTSSVVAAYNYLKKVATALENDPSSGGLRVVNNSWTPNKDVKFKHDATFIMCVSDLSYQYGVASVFASGNSNVDLDSKSFWGTSPIVRNGGAIYVNSLDMTGARSSFSNYGATNTQIFAPGSSIMSTTLTNSVYKCGQYLPSAMKDRSSTYETFTNSNTLKVTNDSGTALTSSYTSTGGFDDEGGYMSISGSQIRRAVGHSAEATTNTRIVLQIPIDTSTAENASEVGLALKLDGLSLGSAWLEVNALGGWSKTDKEAGSLPNGSWTSLSLNLQKVCSATQSKIRVFGEGAGSYIEVAICSGKSAADFPTNCSLSIDTVGLGNAYWHYGFMSGTSMAAPLVTGMLANISYRMDQTDGSYSKLHKSVRPQKLVGIMWKATRKLDTLAGCCSTGGTVDASKIDAAISADKNTVYTGLFDMETDPDDDEYAWYTIHGSGFGSKEGQIFVNMNGSSPVVSGLTWSDTEIKYRAPRMKGYYDTSTKIETENGTQGSTGTISGLDSGDGSDDSKKDDSQKTDDSDNKDNGGKSDDNGSGDTSDADDNNAGGNSSKNEGADSSSPADKTTARTSAKSAAKRSGLAVTGDSTIFGIGILVVAGAGIMAAGVALNHRRQSKR